MNIINSQYAMHSDEMTTSTKLLNLKFNSLLNNQYIYNHEGDKLGDVQEIIFNSESGEVCYLILSFDIFLIGKTHYLPSRGSF